MLGIDIYDRYQDVTSWPAVRDAGVRFVYVKGTDGSGLAAARADGFVAGAKSVGLPVGLYHYAQLSPSPEAQAEILHREVQRLDATGMPPALDLESPFLPNQTALEFARRFLQALRAKGYPRVTLYANTSMLTGIRADLLDVDGLLIWAANYGANTGHRNALPYRGRVNIHQYTSVGRVPGITGNVDLNESLTPLDRKDDDDMPAWWYDEPFRNDATHKNWNFAQVMHRIEDWGEINAARLDGVAKAIAALSNDPDLDRDAVAQMLTDAVAQAAPAIARQTAEQVTGTIRDELLELVGADNEQQADALLNKLAERIAAGATGGQNDG